MYEKKGNRAEEDITSPTTLDDWLLLNRNVGNSDIGGSRGLYPSIGG